MKFKKKLLAMIATVALLATSVTTSVFAVPDPQPHITKSGELSIEKVLTLGDNTNFAPEETFKFSIKPSDVKIGETIDNLKVEKGKDLKGATDISSEAFTNTDKPTVGEKTVKKTATYNFSDKTNVSFQENHPAIYRYEVSENAGSNGPAVTYDKTKYILDVYVNEKAEVVALVAKKLDEHGQPEEQKVPLKFDNKYDTETLAIDKVVNGVSGEKDKDFDFNLLIDNSSTLKVDTVIKAKKIKGNTVEEVEVTVGRASEFKLKDGEKLVCTDLPVGTNYTITEATAAGYTTTVTTENTEEKEKDKGKFSIKDGDNKVHFTNTNNTITPTGLILNVAPYAAGLILVVGLGVLLVVKRRKVTE